ncbi:MAG: hypothetical protein LQ340_000456 [Diploschistes diacapsis]|nr:MAG: hypothetical protein LQ340_000456 [Diploschistes diacapsis]
MARISIQFLPNTKFIFPSARRLPAQCLNYKGDINQWFDIESLSETTRHEELQIPGLQESVLYLKDIIEEEMASGIPANKIVVAGLSQGCATALYLLLTYQLPGSQEEPLPALGAVVGMSGWLPFVQRLRALSSHNNSVHVEASSEKGVKALQEICRLTAAPGLPDKTNIQKTPVFLGHGTLDNKVNIRHGELGRDVLRELGLQVQWRTYEDGHWYTEPEEIDDIVAFLQENTGIHVATLPVQETEASEGRRKGLRPTAGNTVLRGW